MEINKKNKTMASLLIVIGIIFLLGSFLTTLTEHQSTKEEFAEGKTLTEVKWGLPRIFAISFGIDLMVVAMLILFDKKEEENERETEIKI